MHEAKIAEYAFAVISETLKETHPALDKKVKKAVFAIGRPYTVMRDSFEFYFVELTKGTFMEDAELVYEFVEQEGFFVSWIDVED
jgi:Zn finger protein HypA/HybF involved in hydrogenase expression